MHYLHHHLLRLDCRKDVGAYGLFLYVVTELLRYLIAYVGVEQGSTHLLKGFGYINFGDFAFTFQIL